MDLVSEELRGYLSRHTYIDSENKYWKEQLMYALPIEKMAKLDDTRNDDVHDGDDDNATFNLG